MKLMTRHERLASEVSSNRRGSLILSVIMGVLAAAALTAALFRLQNLLAQGRCFDTISYLWHVRGITFNWWLVVTSLFRLAGKWVGRTGGWVVSQTALICGVVIFGYWLVWSNQVRESILHGETGITTSLLIGGNTLSGMVFVAIILNVLWECTLLIAAVVSHDEIGRS
jgi:hypothetical protein